MASSPIQLVALLLLAGVVVAGGLRLFAVSWRRALLVGLVVLPIVVAGGAALCYALVTVIETLELETGGLVFGALATLVVTSAGGVALSRNILYSGFSLMGTLVGVAGLYLFLGADFVGIAQLVIYIGGILVLILFSVLLTNRIGDVRVTSRSVHRGLGAIAAVGVFVVVVTLVTDAPWTTLEAVAAPATARIGDALLREYLLAFELISVVLLMALVGAMVIARHAAKDVPRSKHEAPGLDRLE